MKRNKISMLIFMLGLFVLIISYFIPTNTFEAYTNLRPLGMSTLIICPILGIGGVLFAIREKSLVYALANILLILAFPIVMFIGYNLV
ncbi:hypothetical protein [Anaerococcus tetradius]|uniref:Uncharacterized protein n=1 Tax=Anaerococcus tetradius TaxID=33036 RepID=A0A133KHL3_9FIRM|nr:hypothetical protein [Anaerococcus tetradius]KWZ79021.1 hypothetical protein HMPREF3200_00362 [Anaerococcus tetradius]